VTVEAEDLEGERYEEVMRKRDWELAVATMYKRKDRKVLPVNAPLLRGVNPGGWMNGEDSELKTVPKGSRLTPERLEAMTIGDGLLWESEKQLFVDILFEFEAAIAFDDSEMGLLKPEIEPPIVIHTVPHKPWQQASLRLPKAMQEAANQHVKDKLVNGVLEFSQGPYRSRFFLVEKKKPGEWRFINDVQPLNRVTIRDSGLPPAVDEFSEDFAGYPITSAIDYWSGYFQISLDPASRDLTAFMTDLGLVRQTRLPQGWTNSVATFQRAMGKVHWRQIPHHGRPFIDDFGLKGPKDRYNEEEVSPGVRRFVWEHAQIFREFMGDALRAGLTISGAKSAIGMSGINIVGMVCDYDGRHPDQKKVRKILSWPTPRSTKEARGFIGLAVYYRIFIPSFSIVAAPIFQLFRKGKRFVWDQGCQLAMDELKRRVTETPVLVSLDFSPSSPMIYLQVDASTTVGWGAILSQMQRDGKIRPARYEGGVWSDAEKKQDAVKLECRGLLKALKKLRFWLYGRYFTIETDAQTLIWILNQPPNDLPNAMMTRWLTYIRLFDFDVKHVPGTKNGGADALSRRGRAPGDSDEGEDDVDDYFEAKLGHIIVSGGTHRPTTRIFLNEAEYVGDDLVLGRYLEKLQRPDGLTDQQYQQLRKKSRKFLVRDGLLFKRGGKRNIPPRRVIGTEDRRMEVLKELHDEIGHRGREGTYGLIARRYQWKGMYSDVAKFVESCEECQRRKKMRYEEPLHPTWSIMVWEKIGVDSVYMPSSVEGYGYIVFARDGLSGWVEGRALRELDSLSVAHFVYEDVICRHGLPQRIVMDGGAENLDLTKSLLERYRVKNVHISPYHPQSNGLVERGHGPLVNALSKYTRDGPADWVRYLSLALWSDRITTRRSTGYTPFELVYGRDCLLPVDLDVMSWRVIDWEDVRDREQLLGARIRQLDERVIAETRAAAELEASRRTNKSYFDNAKRLRPEHQRLSVGDLVLLHNFHKERSISRRMKLDDNWIGPYRIYEVSPSGFYRLKEMDGTRLAKSVAGNRIKRFFTRRHREETPVYSEGSEDGESGVDEGGVEDGEEV
jgi:hypothetical protein